MTHEKLEEILQRHPRGYIADICNGCGNHWPCDAVLLLEELKRLQSENERNIEAYSALSEATLHGTEPDSSEEMTAQAINQRLKLRGRAKKTEARCRELETALQSILNSAEDSGLYMFAVDRLQTIEGTARAALGDTPLGEQT